MNTERDNPTTDRMYWIDVALAVSILALTFLLGCVKNRDMDIWWHLKAGTAILNGHGIPTRDTDTFGAAGHAWVDLHWLFQVAVAWLYSLGGMPLLTLAAALIAVAAVGCAVAGTASGRPLAWTLPGWLLAVLAMSDRFFPRPEMITLLCLAIVLSLLRRADRDVRILWLLVPVQLLWVNVQGLFLLGPFLLGCWLFDRFLRGNFNDPRFRRHAVGSAFAVALACLANPYGWRGAVYPVELARTMFLDGSFYSRHIGELTPTFEAFRRTAYRDPGIWASLGLLLAVPATFFFGSGPVNRFRIAIAAAFAGLGLTAVRNIPQFAIVAGAVLSWNLADLYVASSPTHRVRWTSAARTLTAVTVACLFVWIGTGRFYLVSGAGRELGLGEQPHWHAHQAAEYVTRADLPNSIIAYHEGQAALVEFRMRSDQRVYVDPRLEVMGRRVMGEYYDLGRSIAANADWKARLSSLPAPASILISHHTHAPLESTLLADADWKCAWLDPVAAVYVPASSPPDWLNRSGDFAARHFASSDSDFDRRDAASLLLEANWLLRIAVDMNETAAEGGIDRRLLLLNAQRISRFGRMRFGDRGDWSSVPAGAALQLYGPPPRNPADWRPLELLGVARASWHLIQSTKGIQPGFERLSQEYAVAQAVGDVEAANGIAGRMAKAPVFTQQQRQQRAAIRRAHLALPIVSPSFAPSGTNIIPADDPEEQVRSLFDSRRFRRLCDLDAASAFEAAKLSWDSWNRIATACIVCGEPHRAREIWQAASPLAPDEGDVRTRIGLTSLVEEDFDAAIRAFDEAIRENPDAVDARCGLIVAHLELGDAAAVLAACDGMLSLESPPPGPLEFCRRIRSFVERYAAPPPR